MRISLSSPWLRRAAAILLFLLLLAGGPLLRFPLDPALANSATARALCPPLLYYAALAACLALTGVFPLEGGQGDLSCALPCALLLAMLPLGEIPALGGAYGGTSASLQAGLSLSPLFMVLGALFALRLAAALILGRGRRRFSLVSAVFQCALLLAALCFPTLYRMIPLSSPYARALAYLAPFLCALCLLPLARPSRPGGAWLTGVGGLLTLLFVLAYYTPLLNGTLVRALCSLCMTTSALPLYAALLFSGLYSLCLSARQTDVHVPSAHI